jgi:hypothetical protein
VTPMRPFPILAALVLGAAACSDTSGPSAPTRLYEANLALWR